MRRPIKAHLVNRSNRPVQTGYICDFKFGFEFKPVKPDGKPVKPAGIPVRTGWTEFFEFKFEFNRYRPVFGQTGPVYWYRTPAVWPVRSVNETLVGTRRLRPLIANSTKYRSISDSSISNISFVALLRLGNFITISLSFPISLLDSWCCQ